MTREVVVFPTGTANLASVMIGLERAGGTPRLVEDTRELGEAERVVLPGVGAFAPAVAELNRRKAFELLRERIAAGRSTLTICLGLQLLCEGSEESPGEQGLGVLPTQAVRLPDSERVPQLGWNRVQPGADCKLLQEGYAYFANSYCVPQVPQEWRSATTEYSRRFVSAVERGNVLGCQFHPELSGPWGVDLLRRWIEQEPVEC